MDIDSKAVWVCVALMLLSWHTGRALSKVLTKQDGQEGYSSGQSLSLSRPSNRYVLSLVLYWYFMFSLQPGWAWSTHWYILGGSFLLVLASAWCPTKPKKNQPSTSEIISPQKSTWARKTFGTWEHGPQDQDVDEHATHFEQPRRES